MSGLNDWEKMGRKMKIRYLCSSIVIVWLLAGWAHAQEPLLAFPGAEGFGRFAKGGRGGRVIEVTNLNDSGSGSLRTALEAAGPRTVVFRVGGTINLSSPIYIREPFLTVAGQTAAGDGILVRGNYVSVRASEVIVRYMRFRTGVSGDDPGDIDGISVERNSSGPAVSNVMIDHCSVSWGEDETASVWGGSYNTTDITYQWNIIGEGLQSTSVGRSVLIGGKATRITFHHNLLISSQDRNPNIQSGDVDFINNFVYNPGYDGSAIYPINGVQSVNFENNYYEQGPWSHSTKPNVNVRGNATHGAASGIYFNGNIYTLTRPTLTRPESDFFTYKDPAVPDSTTPTIKSARFSSHPIPTMTSAVQARADVLAQAGANKQVQPDGRLQAGKWDAVDLRYFKEINTRTGRSSAIRSAADVGGYPIINGGTPPADTDHDGMPDSWELANGLNDKDASDGPGDHDADGYTNLEEYFNGTLPVSGDVTPPNTPTSLKIQ